jgi:hypothetical protein
MMNLTDGVADVAGNAEHLASWGNSFCGLFCDGSTSSTRTKLSQRYMSAWFNYYLLLKEEFYSIIFGRDLIQDTMQNKIQAEVITQAIGFQGVDLVQRV